MAKLEKKIPVPTALDISVEYKGTFLNNTTVDLFEGGFDTGAIPLGNNGRKTVIVSQTANDLALRLQRTPLAPQDDPSQFPALGGDYAFGPVTGNMRVLIVVAEAKP